MYFVMTRKDIPSLLSSLHLLQIFMNCLLHHLYHPTCYTSYTYFSSQGLDTCGIHSKLRLFVGKAGEKIWGDYCEADAACFGL